MSRPVTTIVKATQAACAGLLSLAAFGAVLFTACWVNLCVYDWLVAWLGE